MIESDGDFSAWCTKPDNLSGRKRKMDELNGRRLACSGRAVEVGLGNALNRLAAHLEKLVHARVLCVGDVMLDRYMTGEVERVSPEAPVPVLASGLVPVLALGLSLGLISLIGMPPAGGFMAKFYIFSAAVQQDLLWLVVIAVINSVVSAFYYLRVVKVMWLGEPAASDKVVSSGALRLAMLLACAGVLILGLVPGATMRIAQLASRMIGF